jgi:3-hydroxybutyryl-CoA dehydrogenase
MARAPGPQLIGVVGAGAMGAGIAQLAAQAGHSVLLADTRGDIVERALAGVRRDLQSYAAKGRIEVAEADAIGARIRAAALAEFAGCGLVIEAIVEDLEVKRALFHELEAIVDEHCILATNTSSLSITALAAGLKHPERVVGMHFFNPPTG